MRVSVSSMIPGGSTWATSRGGKRRTDRQAAPKSTRRAAGEEDGRGRTRQAGGRARVEIDRRPGSCGPGRGGGVEPISSLATRGRVATGPGDGPTGLQAPIHASTNGCRLPFDRAGGDRTSPLHSLCATARSGAPVASPPAARRPLPPPRPQRCYDVARPLRLSPLHRAAEGHAAGRPTWRRVAVPHGPGRRPLRPRLDAEPAGRGPRGR